MFRPEAGDLSAGWQFQTFLLPNASRGLGARGGEGQFEPIAMGLLQSCLRGGPFQGEKRSGFRLRHASSLAATTPGPTGRHPWVREDPAKAAAFVFTPSAAVQGPPPHGFAYP